MFAFLPANIPEPEFIEPENWPAKSPGLNPIKYSIWEHCSKFLPPKDSRLGSSERSAAGNRSGQDLIDKAINHWLIRI